MAPQGCNWCFTLNNYDEKELSSLREAFSQADKVRYAVFGREVGKEGTPHLQGFVSFKLKARLTAAKAVVGDRAHLEVCKGSPEQNFDYCTKGNDFEEFGSRKASGKRADLDAFKDAVKSGTLSRKKLREDFSEVSAKYPRFFDAYILDNIPQPPVQCHTLRPWQVDLNDRLHGPPDDRSVLFVVDKVGNTGKSWFASYYCSLHDSAFILRPTKRADMAYLLPDSFRVLFIDCARKQVESLDYPFVEQVKDGVVVSPKYESRMRFFPNVHVVILMNEDPDMFAMSQDRYVIIELN